MAESLEEHILRLDAVADEAEKAAKAVLGRIRGLRKRIGTGEITQLAPLIDQAAGQLEPLAAALQSTRDSLDFDLPAALTDGRYLAELKAAAAAEGVVLTERDGRLTAFPVLLRLLPQQAALRLGGKIERRLRPALVARELRRRQATGSFNAGGFLNQLFRAYAWAAPHVDARWTPTTAGAGPVVALGDLLEIMQVGGDVAPEAFAVDLLRLDRTPDTRTRQGHAFALPASTGTKGRGRISVYDEAGVEHVYFGIRFSRDSD